MTQSSTNWSSYSANAFGKPVKLWSPHPEYLNLGREPSIRQSRYRALFEVAIGREMVANIRQSAQRGLALGSDRFKDEIEALGNRRQRLLKRGPKVVG